MDTIKYTEIEKESTRVEIHGDNVEVIDVARAEVRKVEIVAAAQAKAIAMKEPAAAGEFAAEEEPAVAEEPADEEELLTEEPAAEEEPEEGSAEEEPAECRIPAENSDETVHVIGVRFRTAGKVYFFDPGQWEVRHGCHVIVETARGVEYGTVVGLPMDVKASKVTQPLKEVIRVATLEDNETERRNRAKEKEAYRICQEKILAHGLEMKLINAEYTFDNSKVLFYFTADGRVDFRDLVKDLASVFRTRIELRQIGVRDETKILGGYGICGRPLCCHTWMSDFIPVSIKMAKEQNLSLNPGKISGVCGRLMCCLKNEADTYEELNRNLPKVGDEVQGNDGLSGQVESVNVLRQTVRILVEVDDEKEFHEYHVSDLTVLRRRRRLRQTVRILVEVDDEKEFHEYHVSDLTVLRRRRRGGNRSRKDNAVDSKEAQELEKLESQERQESRGENKNRGNKNKSNRNKNRRRQENNSNAQ